MASDPWTGFLDWLATVLAPAWGELIDLMPYFVILGVIGPLISIMGLMWLWYLLNRKRGRVRRTEVQAVPAPLDEDGAPEFPRNVPYCEEHALVYPSLARNCQIDRADLSVACPVDGTVRAADVEICSACGTRFVLGANASPTVVTPGSGPPEGGAAVA
jgi:hypothetical protein